MYSSEWLLIDVEKLRESGLLTKYKPIFNKDGTGFVPIPIADLVEHGCIINTNMSLDLAIFIKEVPK